MIFIGADPGVSGSVVAIDSEQPLHYPQLVLGNATELQTWDFISGLSLYGAGDCYAVIEMQTARPTNIPDGQEMTGQRKWRRTVLASTCVLYGSYCSLRSMLVCAGIPYEDCPPKRWQKSHGISKEKGEKDTWWKGRLRELAKQLFPAARVTQPTADAILMADYCRKKFGRVVSA